MKILLGTHNKGKIIEISGALEQLNLSLVSPLDLGLVDAPEETGSTFAENAALKARYFFEQSGLPTVSEDSGIIVDALEGELGVYTKRWGKGENATDAEWVDYFLERMNQEENKRAKFVCHMAYIDADGKLHEFTGECKGHITSTVEHEYLPGLQISGCFKPDEKECVYSALSIDEKNIISHRGKAASELAAYLAGIL